MDHRHVYRHEVTIPGETKLLGSLLTPGCRALDVGCAATGRSARLLRDLGAVVTAFDLSHEATAALADSDDCRGLTLLTADMRRLPFADDSFDLVLVAFHGYDYLVERPDRIAAVSEFARVVRPGGHVVVNTFNRPVCAFNIDGRPTRRMLQHRLRYFSRGGPLRSTFVDLNGLTIRQGILWRTRSEIEAAGDLHFHQVVTRKGRPRPFLWAMAVTPEPYLIFERLPC